MMISETGRNKPSACRIIGKQDLYCKQGFTLIELLCVIAIIAMLFSISIPTISKTASNFYFTSKAKQIEYLLIYLKKTAILEKRKYKLLVDLNKNSYSAVVQTADSDSGYEQYEAVHDSLLSEKKLSSGMGFKTQTEYQQIFEIIFEPNGNISSQEFFVYDQNQHNAKFQTTLSGQIIMELI